MYEPNNYQNFTSSYKRRRLLRPSCVDRLTSLPNDLLTRILSMLPTKDVAAIQVVSKKMKQQAAFCSISSIDLDNSQVSHCVNRPNLTEKFSLFESFTDNLLQKLSESSQSQQPLTRFKLYLDNFKTQAGPIHYYPGYHKCYEDSCSPAMEPARLYTWISFPLAHSGLRELDLRFHVREPEHCNLPPGLFTCQSLQVLKLDSNLEINRVVDVCLPNLKTLHLSSLVLTKDDFVMRLVSNCPILEELNVSFCLWMKADRLIIISNSLRRLTLLIEKQDFCKESDLLLINTPNLEFISYSDHFPQMCIIAPMNSLVKACLCPDNVAETVDYFRINLILLRAVFNVQHLALNNDSLATFMAAGELKNQLPMFGNLRTVKLSGLRNVLCHGVRWDIVLSLLLHRTPMLETIVFSEGFFTHYQDKCVVSGGEGWEIAALEAEGWRSAATNIPSCFRFHLRKIVINAPCGCDRELNMMKFLLGNASVLKELVICESKIYGYTQGSRFNFRQFKKTVEELPKASNSCSIIYFDDEPTFFRNLNWVVI